MKLADVETPSLVQESGTYLLYRTSYRQFCVQMPILLPWQRGPSETSCNDIIKLADPKPPFDTKIWELSIVEIMLWPIRRLGVGPQCVFGENGSPVEPVCDY